MLPFFGLVLFVSLRFSRSRGQVVPVVLRGSTVAEEADGIDRYWGCMAWVAFLYRIPRRKTDRELSLYFKMAN